MNKKNSNFNDLTCLLNNGSSLVASKDFLIKRLKLCESRRSNHSMNTSFFCVGFLSQSCTPYFFVFDSLAVNRDALMCLTGLTLR